MKRTKNENISDVMYNAGKKGDFTLISNELLRSPHLTARAKGLLCLLLSNRKDHWRSYLKSIQKMMADGKDSIRSGLKELENNGHLLLIKYRDKNTKRFGGTIWCYTEEAGVFNFVDLQAKLDKNNIEPIGGLPNNPLTGKASSGKASSGIPYLGNSYLGNPAPNNIKDNNTKKENIYIKDKNSNPADVNKELEFPISEEDEISDKKSSKERNMEFVPFANRLADIVKSNRNIKVDQTKINTWANEIRKLAETDGVNPRRIGDALDWYQDNIGGAYIPVIYSGAAFRSKFLALEDAMNRAGIITHAPTTKHASSPQKLLRKHFPNDTLRKAFYRNCCAPAKHLLGVHEPLEMTDVVKTLVNLHVQITQAQDKNLSADLRKIFPGSLDLIANYIDWVNGQHWIENLQLKMFDLNDGRFSKFRRYQAEEDHMERDPLTGKSYLRG